MFGWIGFLVSLSWLLCMVVFVGWMSSVLRCSCWSCWILILLFVMVCVVMCCVWM